MYGPNYIKDFCCLANSCEHSCCIGWEIDVDEKTYEKYHECDLTRGTSLCSSITEGEEGVNCFTMLDDGRCPHLDDEGLCEIIKELGEEYLADICREHPRFYHVCGGVRECGVGLCCEAAAELILTRDDWGQIVPLSEEIEKSASVTNGFDIREVRRELFSMLGKRSAEYCDRLESLRAYAGITDEGIRKAVLGVASALEYLRDDFMGVTTLSLKRGRGHLFDEIQERALAYFIYRYVSSASNTDEVIAGLRLALALEQIYAGFLDMPTMVDKYGAFECARMLSEEIEYNEDNIDIIRFALMQMTNL